VYPQSSALWSLYILFAALLVFLGQSYAAAFGQERSSDVLAAFLLAGAVLNAAAGVLQIGGIPQSLDAFVSHLHGRRAIGNVGQSNLYANYLALGEASLIYLFARNKVGLGAGIPLAILLLTGAALSASRTSLLYLGCFTVLGLVARYRSNLPYAERIHKASLAMLFAGLLVFWLVPIAVNNSGFNIEGGFSRSVPSEWASTQDATAGLRILAWKLAWQLFSTAPVLGVGAGEFAGAGFAYGLPPAMATGDVWTSPHNLLLQLLAEIGLLGTVPILAGLLIWMRRFGGEFLRSPNPATWWISACVSVGLLHAMLEYPLWYANFLAVSALMLGIGSSGGVVVRAAAIRTLIGGSAVAGSIVLASVLYDYVRFDLAISPASGRSLAPESEVLAGRARLRDLGHGLLAPRAELWLFLAQPFDGNDMSEKLSLGQRVLRVWPSSQVVAHQAILLALAGREKESVGLITQGLKSSASQRAKISDIVANSPSAARAVLQPAIRAILQRPS
jgi:O-antigen ligase